MHYFHEPLPHKSNQISILNFSLGCGSMSPINFAYHLKNLPLRKQSMNCFSQSIKNMPKNFLSLIGFLVGDCSYILILLVLSKVLTFVNVGILIIKTMTILPYSEWVLYGYGYWGCSQMLAMVSKKFLSLKSVTHIFQWWNLVQLYLT